MLVAPVFIPMKKGGLIYVNKCRSAQVMAKMRDHVVVGTHWQLLLIWA